MGESHDKATMPDHIIPMHGDVKNNNNAGDMSSMNPEKSTVLLEREIEKRKIRAEIIASEMMNRRQELEAEVRMELMMEIYALGASDDNIEGKMSLNNRGGSGGDVSVCEEKMPIQDVALGKWAFGRDPSVVASQIAGKSNAELAKVPEELLEAQVTPRSGITGVKRKAKIAATACDKEITPAMSTDSRKFYCSICEVSTTSEVTFNAHLQGKKHKAKEAKLKANDAAGSINMDNRIADNTVQAAEPSSIGSSEKEKHSGNNKWECSLCQLSVTSETLLISHLQGKKHKAKQAKLQISEAISNMEGLSTGAPQEVAKASTNADANIPDNKWYCSVCGVSASSENNMNDHLKGKKHRSKAGLPQQETSDINHESAKTVSVAEDVKEEGLCGGETLNDEGTNPVGDDTRNEPDLIAKPTKNLAPEQTKIPFNKDIDLNPQEAPDAPDLDCGQTDEYKVKQESEREKDSDKQSNLNTELVKYWHCKMCNKGTHDEATMAAHRKSTEHITLLKKIGGGVMTVANIPREALPQ